MLIGLLWLLAALIYLVPLPVGLSLGLAGREPIAAGLAQLGVTANSLPISLDPNASISSILRLLPPAAMFLIALQMTQRQRRRLAYVVLAVAVVSVALGIVQLVGGERSTMRFYAITNPNLPVGFFANGNHQATLLLCAIAFAGYLAARAIRKGGSRSRRSGGAIVSAAMAIFLVVGLLMIGSMAGYGLLLPAALASLLIYRREAFGSITRKWLAAIAIVFVLFLGAALAGPISNQALAGELSDAPTSRKVIGATTLQAIGDYLPLGSGLGTFPHVYRTYSDPYRAMAEYVNHAHNDYLEVALEMGLPGLLLVALFIAWWVRRSFAVWTGEPKDAALASAASVIIGVVLLHSIVDYPIRTSAIAAVFAAACALIMPARRQGSRSAPVSADEAPEQVLRHLSAD
jgi:O-antigen ligase